MSRDKFFGAIIALLLSATVICIGFYAVKQVNITGVKTAFQSVILDAGHGGFDGGATGVDKTLEKDINLAITQKLADIAQLGGFDVIMVRDSDTAVNDEDAVGLRKKKVSDIHNRLKLAEQYPNAIFLSVHQNHFTQEKYWGTQVFYGKNNSDSKVLAQKIQNVVCRELQPENKREIKPAEKNLYILYNAKNPAVLVECGFLSNTKECKRLMQADYQQQLAFKLLQALTEHCYFTNAEGNV